MADRRLSMSPTEVSRLKEALLAQQELLQQLHNELEAEREASATAASETLSVILRLQEEKAGVKMEAEQYKRLAEEKMCHAEESFAVVEDVILEKDMEVADLEYKLQCYEHKLMSIGCVNPDDGDLMFPENVQPGSGNLGDNPRIGTLGRRNSEPVPLKVETHRAGKQIVKDLKGSTSDSAKKISNSSHEGISSYGDQIKELNQRVRGILGGERSDLNVAAIVDETEQAKHSMANKDANIDHPCSPGVLDVFEVPQVDEGSRTDESPTKGQKMAPCRGTEILECKDDVGLEGIKPCSKDDKDWIRKRLSKTSVCAGPGPTECAPEPSGSPSHVNWMSAISEGGRTAEVCSRQEQLSLLKEIEEKLNLLREEIRTQKAKNLPRQTDKPVDLDLPEAMLHFWI